MPQPSKTPNSLPSSCNSWSSALSSERSAGMPSKTCCRWGRAPQRLVRVDADPMDVEQQWREQICVDEAARRLLRAVAVVGGTLPNLPATARPTTRGALRAQERLVLTVALP